MPYRKVSYAEQVWYILRYKFMEVMPMPRKPKKPCSYPGCPELTEGRYCEKHQKQENARYEKYDRDPAVRRRYGRAWKRIRDSYVKTHPFCEQCWETTKNHGPNGNYYRFTTFLSSDIIP